MLTSDPAFKPPFCPRPSCPFHRDPKGWVYHADGYHERLAAPHRIRRFRCTLCGRCFSTQTFDTTYWLKRPDVQRPLFHGLVACSGFRQLGRSLGVAASTLQRQASMLGRHCLLFQQSRQVTDPPSEPLALDGLVSFEYSQYWPFEINVLVGTKTHYVYGFTLSELRRSGGMTKEQKKRRDELEEQHGKPDPQATRKAVEAVFAVAVPQSTSLTVHSDQHAAYPRAFRRLPHAIEHHAVSSRRCRTVRNPLFVVDLLDLLVRHGGANHKRETIAFSKRRQGAAERMAINQVWRNFMKKTCERESDSACPAQLREHVSRRLTLDDVLWRRLFPSLVPLPSPLDDYYWRRVPTRQIPNGTRHALKYAA